MNNELETLKEWHDASLNELKKIMEKIVPLQEQKNILEAKITKYKDLISLLSSGNNEHEKNQQESIQIGLFGGNTDQFKNLSPMNAYRKIIESIQDDKEFNESEVRNIANSCGVKTRDGNEIKSPTSRSMFAKLKEAHIIDSAPQRGFYKKKSKVL